jgi:3-oxoacyl-[acyl-carrier protein] reductase
MQKSNMKFDFSEKTILVTGATRGIGKQIADDLFELGAKLILTGTNKTEISLLNSHAKKNNLNKVFFAVNFNNDNQTKNFIKSILKFPRIDGLVNNAGINKLNSIDKVNDNDWSDMISVNLTAPFKILSALSNKMIKNKYGRVVNISSIFGVVSKEKRSVYSATKFGIHGITVGASNDLSKHNILVNTVSPGFVLTDLTKKNLSKKEMIDIKNQIPAKRLAETKDISSVIVFLLSNLNSYVTGQNIVIDGGFTNV